MKKIFLILGMMLVAIPVFSQGITFDDISLGEGLEKARRENKLVFIDCYTSWCGPCKLLAERVFTQNEVGDFFNANFINLKIDMEKGEGPELAERFSVKAYPTMLILDANGNVRHKIVGYTEGPELIAQGRDGMDDSRSFSALAQAYESGERDPAMVERYIIALLKGSEKEKAKEVADGFFATLADEHKTGPALWPIYANVTVANWGSPWLVYLIDNKHSFDEAMGRETVDDLLYEAATSMFTDAMFFNREGVSMAMLPEITETIRKIDFEGRDKVVAEAEFTMALMAQDVERTVDLFEKYGRRFSNKGIMNLLPLMIQNKESTNPETHPATAALVKLIEKTMQEGAQSGE